MSLEANQPYLSSDFGGGWRDDTGSLVVEEPCRAWKKWQRIWLLLGEVLLLATRALHLYMAETLAAQSHVVRELFHAKDPVPPPHMLA